MLKKLFHFLFPCEFDNPECKESLFGCICGKGDDKPDVPVYQEDPETTRLKNQLLSQASGLLDTPYETYEQRFTPSEDYTGIVGDITKRYQTLLDETDYSLDDYQDISQNYLDTVLRKYSESREESLEGLREGLLAENLYGSGPGFGIEAEFGEETSQGVSDIATQWAYENIDRQFQQRAYMDALQRGDYSNLFNIALQASQYDIQPAQLATQAQLQGLAGASGVFGGVSSYDLGKYQTDVQRYQNELAASQQGGTSLSGLGTGVGTLAGLALALPTGGVSPLAGAAIGGMAGGGFGSLFEY